ncbi:MAG: ankyrin repeat domain-containing protein [Acidobacteriota bacterium]
MFCSACGGKNADDDLFCGVCGKALVVLAPQPVVPAEPSGVDPTWSSTRYVWVAFLSVILLGVFGFVGYLSYRAYSSYSEEASYERSLQHRSSEERFLLRAQNGETGELRALLAAGLSPSTKDGATGATALMLATAGGYPETVQFLIEAGANVNAKDANGTTALMWAARGGHTQIVGRLLTAGADPTTNSAGGLTALKAANAGGHSDIAQLLQAAGARE